MERAPIDAEQKERYTDVAQLSAAILGGLAVGSGLYVLITDDGRALVRVSSLHTDREELASRLDGLRSDQAVFDEHGVPSSSEAYKHLATEARTVQQSIVSIDEKINTLTPDHGFLPGIAGWWFGAALAIGGGINLLRRRAHRLVSSNLTR